MQEPGFEPTAWSLNCEVRAVHLGARSKSPLSSCFSFLCAVAAGPQLRNPQAFEVQDLRWYRKSKDWRAWIKIWVSACGGWHCCSLMIQESGWRNQAGMGDFHDTVALKCFSKLWPCLHLSVLVQLGRHWATLVSFCDSPPLPASPPHSPSSPLFSLLFLFSSVSPPLFHKASYTVISQWKMFLTKCVTLGKPFALHH